MDLCLFSLGSEGAEFLYEFADFFKAYDFRAMGKKANLSAVLRLGGLCVLGRSELIALINRYRIIHPFDEKLLDGDSYVLTVREDTTLNYLEHKNLISHEVVFTPPDTVAHLTAKSRYGRMGLSFLNAAKVHSGFVGRLALEIVNLSNDRSPITINRGDPFMHIEFLERRGGPSPYRGEYMFQYMSEEEVAMYVEILTKNFPHLYTRELLLRQASVRIGV